MRFAYDAMRESTSERERDRILGDLAGSFYMLGLKSAARDAFSIIAATAQEQYQIASDILAAEIPKLRKLVEQDIKALEKQLDAAGAPPTPGRLPDWKGGR